MATNEPRRHTWTTVTMTHPLRITAVTAFVTLCTLLPFLPGRYDSLAIPLSSMAQVIGTAGLVLVPVGVVWIAVNRYQRAARRRRGFAILALIVSSMVWAVVCLAAVVQSGAALGGGAFALWGYAVWRVWPKATLVSADAPVSSTALPFYLIAVPIAAAVLVLAVVRPAVEFSRNRAIRNSAPLIAAIEQYHATHGRYPMSLWAGLPDYHPGVIGIPQYHYEPNGVAYNLSFEQFTYGMATHEFVMYNPRDEHIMSAHAGDRLRHTPEELNQEWTRSYYALHATPHPHWKYFWFD